LSEEFIKRTVQLENITSLKAAIERAMTVKVIQENSLNRNEKRKFYFEKGEKKNGNFNRNKFSDRFQKKNTENNKECWQCGARGHYRSECPTLAGKGNAN
jgi:hypothetical protein